MTREQLTATKVQNAVVEATPVGTMNGEPSDVTLGDLGVLNAETAAVFVQEVNQHINPWKVDDADVASAPSNTVQEAVDSILANAF